MKTKIENTLSRRAARWIVNGIFVVAALGVGGSALSGCALDAERLREIYALEAQLARADAELSEVGAAAASGALTPETAAARTRALEVRISSLSKRLELLKSQPPAGVSLLESILIAAAAAFGLRGTPTGGLGGMIVNFLGGLFSKKKPPLEGSAA